MTTPMKKKPNGNAAPKDQDATALLRADHKAVSALFEAYEKTRSTAKKKELVSQICTELSVCPFGITFHQVLSGDCPVGFTAVWKGAHAARLCPRVSPNGGRTPTRGICGGLPPGPSR